MAATPVNNTLQFSLVNDCQPCKTPLVPSAPEHARVSPLLVLTNGAVVPASHNAPKLNCYSNCLNSGFGPDMCQYNCLEQPVKQQ